MALVSTSLALLSALSPLQPPLPQPATDATPTTEAPLTDAKPASDPFSSIGSPLEVRTPDPLLAATLMPEPVAPPVLGSSKFSYTYAQLDYVYSDLHDVPGHQDGYNAIASLNLMAGFYLQGNYSYGSGSGTNLETYRIGAGYHLSITDELDLFGLISYEHDYAKSGGVSGTGTGYEFDGGARFKLAERLELDGQFELNHVDETDFGVLLGARFYILDPLSVGLSGEWIDQDFRMALGARFQF
jgi:opacity protein-like surface antigen